MEKTIKAYIFILPWLHEPDHKKQLFDNKLNCVEAYPIGHAL